jgi:hypothetical protein
MEAQDLERKIKDVQRLRVTRHMTLEGDNGSPEDRNRKDNETLERTIKQQQKVMEAMVAARKRQVGVFRKRLEHLGDEMGALDPAVAELANTVGECATMCQVHVAATGGASHGDQRLRTVAARGR